MDGISLPHDKSDVNVVAGLIRELCDAVAALEKNEEDNCSDIKHSNVEMETQYFEIIQETQAFNSTQTEMIIEENISTSENSSTTVPDFVIKDASGSNLKSSMDDRCSAVVTLVPETDLSDNTTNYQQSSISTRSTCLSQ